MAKRSETFLGYPCNNSPGNSVYGPLLEVLINNVGDPYHDSNYQLNSHNVERELIAWFAKLHGLPKSDTWGYLTSGGTEGNIFGLYLGRERFPSATLFFSSESHYSVAKAARLLRLPCKVIPTNPNGQINLQALAERLSDHRGGEVIINLNLGTTMKGAIDDVKGILDVLNSRGIERYHLHADAALFGAMNPLLPETNWPDFKYPISSMAISGHKFIGCPVPCGIVLTRNGLVEDLHKPVEYIGSVDSTLAGSRSGLAALILWDKITKLGTKGLTDEVLRCWEVTQYAVDILRSRDWPAYANPHSNIVVTKRPDEALVRRWQLASENDISHLIVMPHVDRALIDRFAEELFERCQARA